MKRKNDNKNALKKKQLWARGGTADSIGVRADHFFVYRKFKFHPRGSTSAVPPGYGHLMCYHVLSTNNMLLFYKRESQGVNFKTHHQDGRFLGIQKCF